MRRTAATGGRPKLLGITKRGNKYLRMLFIHGARAALPSLARSEVPLGHWLRGLLARAHRNVVVVALAAKLSGSGCWSLLVSRATSGDCPDLDVANALAGKALRHARG